MKKLSGLLAAAILSPLSASAIAFTITQDSDALWTSTFQSQFQLSENRRGGDVGSFAATYWSGSFDLRCSPDMGSWVSFVPTFRVGHTSAGSGRGTTLEGNYESMFLSDRAWSGGFTFQPYYYYSPGGDWFKVSSSYTYDPSSRMVNVNGLIQAYRGSLNVPDSANTAGLLLLAFGTLTAASQSLRDKT